MSKCGSSNDVPSPVDWRTASHYSALLKADRRAFAWEWLRRHAPYRNAWVRRDVAPSRFGLLAYEDPDHATPDARPIWNMHTDSHVIESWPKARNASRHNSLDIRAFADFVTVEVDENDIEHWLLSDGRWIVRLDLHEGTLLGGPVLLEHRFAGFEDAEPKLDALKRLSALARRGAVPPSLLPRERRAPRWVLELRTADALAAGATQQDIARAFFGSAIDDGWRSANDSYRLRVRRLVRAARANLQDPFSGPWLRPDGMRSGV
jgi:hypothetical protein